MARNPERRWHEKHLPSGSVEVMIRRKQLPSGYVRKVFPPGRLPKGTQRQRIDRWAIDQIQTIEDGTWVDPRSSAIPFRQVAETWFATKATKKPTTVADYATQLRLRVLPKWGDRPVASITSGEIKAWLVGMAGDGQGTSIIRRGYIVLASVLDLALEERRITSNPARLKSVRSVVPTTPRKVLKRTDVLPFTDLLRLSEATMVPGPLRELIPFLGGSGVRFGEAAALRRSAVTDFGIYITESVSEVSLTDPFDPSAVVRRTFELGVPKNHEERFVEVPKVVMRRLRTHLTQWVGPSADALVFAPVREGDEYLSASWFSGTIWPAALKESGLTHRRLHTLRATAASTWLSVPGVSVEWVREQLGHADLATTQKDLASLNLGRGPSIIDQVNAVLTSTMDAGKESGRRADGLAAVVDMART